MTHQVIDLDILINKYMVISEGHTTQDSHLRSYAFHIKMPLKKKTIIVKQRIAKYMYHCIYVNPNSSFILKHLGFIIINIVLTEDYSKNRQKVTKLRQCD